MASHRPFIARSLHVHRTYIARKIRTHYVFTSCKRCVKMRSFPKKVVSSNALFVKALQTLQTLHIFE